MLVKIKGFFVVPKNYEHSKGETRGLEIHTDRDVEKMYKEMVKK
jgi:hypothetical protein